MKVFKQIIDYAFLAFFAYVIYLIFRDFLDNNITQQTYFGMLAVGFWMIVNKLEKIQEAVEDLHSCYHHIEELKIAAGKSVETIIDPSNLNGETPEWVLKLPEKEISEEDFDEKLKDPTFTPGGRYKAFTFLGHDKRFRYVPIGAKMKSKSKKK